jgi:molecular chaperone GrpE
MEKDQNAIDKNDQAEVVIDQNLNDEIQFVEESAETERDYENEINVLKDQLLRTIADSENTRKRSEKQAEDAAKYAVSSFAKDLISVMENLCRTTDSISKTDIQSNPALKTLSEGVEMTKRELTNVFERNGIKRIQPIAGDPFDHNLHQAVMHIADNNFKPGTVVQILQAGYLLRDRLLTPAMVGVAKEE